MWFKCLPKKGDHIQPLKDITADSGATFSQGCIMEVISVDEFGNITVKDINQWFAKEELIYKSVFIYVTIVYFLTEV